jgi:hypothetical protein
LFVLILTSLAFPLGAVGGVYFGGDLAYPYAFLVSAILGGSLASVPLIFVYIHYVPFVARTA